MISTGIVRSIDSLGRVVLPKELRNTYGITPDTPLEIFTDREGEIILKKYSPMAELSTFAIELNVQAQVSFKGDSQEYINIKCYVPQPQSAKVGAYLRVKAVDDQGRIQAVETAAPDSISDDHMNALIDAKLGVIENGAY